MKKRLLPDRGIIRPIRLVNIEYTNGVDRVVAEDYSFGSDAIIYRNIFTLEEYIVQSPPAGDVEYLKKKLLIERDGIVFDTISERTSIEPNLIITNTNKIFPDMTALLRTLINADGGWDVYNRNNCRLVRKGEKFIEWGAQLGYRPSFLGGRMNKKGYNTLFDMINHLIPHHIDTPVSYIINTKTHEILDISLHTMDWSTMILQGNRVLSRKMSEPEDLVLITNARVPQFGFVNLMLNFPIVSTKQLFGKRRVIKLCH